MRFIAAILLITALVAMVLISGCCGIIGKQIAVQTSAPATVINDSLGYSVIPVNDGYVIAGTTDKYGNQSIDAYLIKTDLNGNMVWNKTYSENYGCYGYSVIAVSDGYVLAGVTYKYQETGHLSLIKTDLNGNMLWNKTYGNGTSANSIILDNDDLIIAGNAALTNDMHGVYLAKIDLNGNMIWNKTYGDGSDWGSSITAINNGYAITGIKAPRGNRSMDLFKTDLNGDLVLNKTYSGRDNWGSSIVAVNDGYIIAGTVDMGSANASDTNDRREIQLIKTDLNGNMVWNQTYAGNDKDNGNSVIAVNDGYVIAGNSGSFEDGISHVYLVKTDLNGNMVWNKTYGRGEAASVVNVNDGYIIVGDTSSYGMSPYDVYLIKTDLNGNTVWNKTYSGTNLSPHT